MVECKADMILWWKIDGKLDTLMDVMTTINVANRGIFGISKCLFWELENRSGSLSRREKVERGLRELNLPLLFQLGLLGAQGSFMDIINEGEDIKVWYSGDTTASCSAQLRPRQGIEHRPTNPSFPNPHTLDKQQAYSYLIR